jgi:hypothetical protein
MDDARLPGGNGEGATRVGDTVRRRTRPWTPAVHALLRHLETVGFDGAPRVLGFDEQGREVLSYLPGDTVGEATPWPEWARSDAALVAAGRWLRRYHDAVRAFVPPEGSVWHFGSAWRPGLVVAHNDAGPYNAAWRAGELSGFFDWDFAGPIDPLLDLGFVAFSWIPLFDSELDARRPARLRLLLESYGADVSERALLDAAVIRVRDLADTVERLGTAGDPAFAVQAAEGSPPLLRQAARQIERFGEAY